MTTATRWLITGATGLLGSNAAVQLSEDASVVGAARTPPSRSPVEFEAVDLSDAHSRAGLVERASTDAVFHAAALSSIEVCEQNPELARAVNVTASADLASQAHAAGAAFVYISTDAVFDGTRGPYSESDIATPTTIYGQTKLDGEHAVLEANPNALVARVNFYGWSPSGTRSLAEFFHSRLSRGEQVPGFRDVIVSTLYVGYLIDYVAALVSVGASGLVNVVSSEPISKFEFGRGLAHSFGFDENLVKSASSAEHLTVKRGANLELSTERLSSLLGTSIAGQKAGLDRLVADYADGRVANVRSYSAE